MSALGAEYYGNSLLQWIIAVVIFVVTAGVLVIARVVALRLIRPKSKVRAFLRVAISHTRYTFLAVVSAAAASIAVTLPASAPHIIRVVAAIVVLLQIGWWAHGIVSFWVERTTRKRARSNLGSVTTVRALGIVVKLGIWMVVGISVMAAFGINVTAVVAGLGVGGIAIALAVQNIMGDLFASVSIILDKPFVVGDLIRVGEQVGRVEEIGVKTTRLRSLGGEQLIFGNGDLLSSRIQNYRRMTERRAVFTIGVEYGTPQESVEAIPGMIREAIEAQEKTRVDRIHFKEYGDSSLNFECVYYVLSNEYNDYMDAQQAINLALYRRFAEHDISFAFPTRTLMVRMPVTEGGSEDTADPRVARSLS